LAAVLELSLQILLGILLPAWVIRRDLAGLSAQRLARAWNEASLWSAVVTFGPLSLIVHFARTRRSLVGFALGVGWALVALVASALLGAAFE
jgi:hypothetical protein